MTSDKGDGCVCPSYLFECDDSLGCVCPEGVDCGIEGRREARIKKFYQEDINKPIQEDIQKNSEDEIINKHNQEEIINTQNLEEIINNDEG